jgi:hypothetical protein
LDFDIFTTLIANKDFIDVKSFTLHYTARTGIPLGNIGPEIKRAHGGGSKTRPSG